MSLENIGQKLKAARENRGLSLVQVYERTKIPINHLQSIEGGIAEDLPEAVYVAGFIRRYADCIGLNGQTLSDEYRKLIEEQGDNGNSTRTSRAAGAQPVYVTPQYLNRVKLDRPAPNPLKWMAFYGFWAILMVGLVIVLFNWVQNNNPTQQDPSVLALKQSTAKFNAIPAQAPPITSASQTEVTLPTTEDNKGSRIALSASQHVWVEVKSISSGDSLFTGYMETGDRRDFEDPQGLRVHAGNGGSLSVEFQGKTQTLGGAGKVAERTFVAQNTDIANTENQEQKTTSPANSTSADTTQTVAKPVVANKNKRSSGAESSALRTAHSRAQEAAQPESDSSRNIEVPYRYTEGHQDTE